MTHHMNRIRQSRTSRVLHVINAGVLLFLAVIMLYPMWDSVIVSISPATYASQGGLKLWPAGGISFGASMAVFGAVIFAWPIFFSGIWKRKNLFDKQSALIGE